MQKEYQKNEIMPDTEDEKMRELYQDTEVTLEIYFTGLCAIVPQREIENPHNEATILLVDAAHSSHGTHHTLLLVDPNSYPNEPTNRKTESKIFYNKPPVEPVTVCTLGAEVLTITGRDAAGARVAPARESLQLITGLRRPGECPSGSTVPDVTWIAQHPGVLNRGLLTSLDPGGPVSVRMSLTQGTMATEGFRQNDRGVVSWKFGPGPSSPLAEDVVYKIVFPASSRIRSIVLESTPFENTPEQLDIHLLPVSGRIAAWIVNLPLAGLLGLPPKRHLDPDYHFAEFHRLCADYPPLLIPTPDPMRYCRKLTAPTNPKCPPTLFTSTSDADTSNSREAETADTGHENHLESTKQRPGCSS